MVSSHYLKVLRGKGKEVKNPFTISHYRTATNGLQMKKETTKKQIKSFPQFIK